MMHRSRHASPVLGVDAAGKPDIDPTKNVLDKVTDAVRRIDDLREAEQVRAHEAIAHLRSEIDLRAGYEEKLRLAEAARLDAIRDVDQGTVAGAASVQATQANILAATVASSAEAMSARMRADLTPVQTAIADLQRARYESAGGAAQVVETRQTGNARSSNWGLWVGTGIAVLVGGISSLVGLIGLALAAYVALGR